MILTVTLNPSVDRRYILNNFEKGGIFRAKEVEYTAGGKGLNVTRVIKNLKRDVVATGFLGGKSGEFIAQKLQELNVQNEFVKIHNNTRSCIAILSKEENQTEILEPGPEIFHNEAEAFYEKYENIIKKCNIICASGSLPKNISKSMYKEMIKIAKNSGKKFILDTSGEALKEGIKASPYMIKPNQEELESIVGNSITNEKELINAIKILMQYNISIIVISLGKQGSMIYYKNKLYKVKVPNINAINPVGSGDSMIAGFAVGIDQGYNFEQIIKFAAACGTANAMEKETGKVDIQNVKKLINKITIEKLKFSR